MRMKWTLALPTAPGAVLAAALVLAPAVAHGMPSFPVAIATHLGTSHVPDCTVCHQGTQTTGTAVMPLAVALQSRGLTATNPSSINTALDALAADHTDSDGDGIPDVDELKKGWDPNFPSYPDGGNIPGGVIPSTLTPSYGCALARSDGHLAAVGALLWSGVLALLCLRRRTSPRAGVAAASAPTDQQDERCGAE